MAPLFSLFAFAALALFANVVVVVVASPHIPRHALDHRQHNPVLPRLHLDSHPPVRRRSLNKRCTPHPTNATTSPVPSPTGPSVSATSPSSQSPTSPPPSPTSPPSSPTSPPSSPTSPPSSPTSAPESPSSPPPPPATPTPTPSPTSSPPPAQTSASSSNNGGPSYLYGTHVGDGTWFDVGLGACGITNNNGQNIVAVSHDIFDSYPGYDGVNPNTNPVCGKSITITYEGHSIDVTVTDRCVGCAMLDLDMAPGAFGLIAALSVGRIQISWAWK